jgi:hypothetical protein
MQRPSSTSQLANAKNRKELHRSAKANLVGTTFSVIKHRKPKKVKKTRERKKEIAARQARPP